MTLADDAAASDLSAQEIEAARAAYEAYAARIGVVARWETLPARLQLGWAAAVKAAKKGGASPHVSPGTARGEQRFG